MSRLRITVPELPPREHTLAPGRTTIGRASACELSVDHSTLSKFHAAIESADGGWTLLDVGSRNGVRMAGKLIVRVALQKGDKFSCGKVEFEFLGDMGVSAPVSSTAEPPPTTILQPVAAAPVLPAVPGALSMAPIAPASPLAPVNIIPTEPVAPAPKFAHRDGIKAASTHDDSITTEIPPVGSRAPMAFAIAALAGIAVAAGVGVMMMKEGGAVPGKKQATAKEKPVAAQPLNPKPPDPEVKPPDSTPVDPVTEESDTRKPPPREDEVQILFRDGTSCKAKVTRRSALDVEVERLVSGKRVLETYPIEDILRIGAVTIRPNWALVFARRLEMAGDDRARLRALEAWCREVGYNAGVQVVLDKMGEETVTVVTPPKAKTARYGGREVDVQELRADGRLDARGRLVMGDADLRYLRDVTFDTIGRSPTEDEIQKAAAESRAETVTRLLASVEFYETWYEEELYYFLLLDNFRPATERLTALPKRLSAGTLTLPDALHEIVICQYFNHRNPGNDTYVTVILEQLLGITVQDQPMLLKVGKQMYDGYPGKMFNENGSSQADLVSIVLKQKRFHEIVLQRIYKRLTGIAMDARVLVNNVDRVVADSKAYPDVMKEWLLDDRYIARSLKLRSKSDHQFIRALYVDLMGRRTTYDEFRLFRNALQALADPTPIRSVLAKVMVDSDQVKVGSVKDAAVWVKDTFVRMLGRMPTAGELKAFVPVVESGKPKLVLQAIVDSDEYQLY